MNSQMYATTLGTEAIFPKGLRKKSFAELGKGAVAGALGGLVGAFTMSLSAWLWRKLLRQSDFSRTALIRLEAHQFVDGSSQELDSISAAADRIDRMLGHKLSPRQKGLVAAAVHYAAGTGLGGIYGVLAEVIPAIRLGAGTAFGVGESIAVESVGNSVLGLTRPLREYSPAEHLQSAVDHAVYGLTLELTRSIVRRTL